MTALRWLVGFVLRRHRETAIWVTIRIGGVGETRAWKPRQGDTVIHLLDDGEFTTARPLF